MRYLGLGAEIMVSLAGPIAVGFLLDHYLGIQPFGTLSGVAIGMILFFMLMLRLVDSFSDKQE